VEEQRVIIALQRTDDGRELAGRFICGDETRYRRIVEFDGRYARATTLFAARFEHGWRQDGGERARSRVMTSGAVTIIVCATASLPVPSNMRTVF